MLAFTDVSNGSYFSILHGGDHSILNQLIRDVKASNFLVKLRTDCGKGRLLSQWILLFVLASETKLQNDNAVRDKSLLGLLGHLPPENTSEGLQSNEEYWALCVVIKKPVQKAGWVRNIEKISWNYWEFHPSPCLFLSPFPLPVACRLQVLQLLPLLHLPLF